MHMYSCFTSLYTRNQFNTVKQLYFNKLCVCQSLSRICLFVTPWTVAQPGSSAPGILQERILEWVAIPFFRGSSQPRDPTQVSCFAGRFFYSLSHQGSQEVLNTLKLHKSLISHQSAKILFIIFSFHLYSDIIDIQHCICLRCIAYCFD